MEKGEFELAQILLFPILKLVLSQPHTVFDGSETVFGLSVQQTADITQQFIR
jgi:hypothetical protein